MYEHWVQSEVPKGHRPLHLAMHGCESWAMTKADKKRVEYVEHWCYRILLRVSWTGRTDQWVPSRISSCLMSSSMAKRKMRFFSDIKHKDGMEKRLTQRRVEGRRPRGRSTVAWCQDKTGRG